MKTLRVNWVETYVRTVVIEVPDEADAVEEATAVAYVCPALVEGTWSPKDVFRYPVFEVSSAHLGVSDVEAVTVCDALNGEPSETSDVVEEDEDEEALLYVFDGGPDHLREPSLVRVPKLNREQADVVMDAWCQDMSDLGVPTRLVGVARVLWWGTDAPMLQDTLRFGAFPKTVKALTIAACDRMRLR